MRAPRRIGARPDRSVYLAGPAPVDAPASPAIIRNAMRATLLLAPLLASCAATFGSGPFPVPIDSSPQGAIVSYQGNDVGRTPCTVSMRSASSVVTLRLDGHHPRDVDAGTIPNAGWIFLGFLLWGPFELLVDAAAGAWSSVNDEPIKVELAPSAADPLPLWVRPKYHSYTVT